MNQVLGARDTNAWLNGPRGSTSKAGASGAGPDCTPFGAGTSSAWTSGDAGGSRFSPLTQQRSQMQTPELRQGCAVAAAADDVSSSSRGVTPEWGGAEGNGATGHQVPPPPLQQQQAQQQHNHEQQAPGSAAPSRPASAAGSVAAAVDAADVRRLVNTVEALQVGAAIFCLWAACFARYLGISSSTSKPCFRSLFPYLQRQLAVKNDRIKQLRQALESASAAGASFSPAPSRPGSVAAGSSGDTHVLRQKLEAATAAADNLRALNHTLEGQLSEAQQAQRAVQAQLAAATRRLAALFDAAELGSSGDASTSAHRPSSAGDAGGVLLLQVCCVWQRERVQGHLMLSCYVDSRMQALSLPCLVTASQCPAFACPPLAGAPGGAAVPAAVRRGGSQPAAACRGPAAQQRRHTAAGQPQ